MASFSPIRHNSNTVAPVTAPKPCQTSSRRAEFTSKNSPGVIMWTDHAPKSSENKRRSWASDSEDDDDEEKEKGTNVSLEAEKSPAVGSRPMNYHSYRTSMAENQYPTPREERVAESLRKQGIAELREEGTRKLAGGVNERKEHPVVLKVIKRSIHVVVESEGSAPFLTKDKPMVLQHADGINNNPQNKEIATEAETRSPSWANEMKESTMDAAEKERHHKIKAMEQQQLILQQVAAARRTKTKSAKKMAIVKRHVAPAVVENSEIRNERLQHQNQRQPRTRGLSFIRLSGGQLVRIDRHGKPSANNLEEDSEETEDFVAGERKEEPPSSAETSKKFTPAPIPKVSAWAKVLPVRAKGGTEPHHDQDPETEADHSLDHGNVHKGLATNVPHDKKEEKHSSDRRCNKRQSGRRNGKGGSFRSRNGPYERQ